MPQFESSLQGAHPQLNALLAGVMESSDGGCDMLLLRTTEDQVTHLFQGPQLLICDICVDACIDTLATKDRDWRERQIDYLLRLRHRREQTSPPPANPN
jgi:hypothetical protein